VTGDALWYFAYGSNMSGAILRERRGLTPRACRPATLGDYRLVFTLPVGPGEALFVDVGDSLLQQIGNEVTILDRLLEAVGVYGIAEVMLSITALFFVG